jgi:hypothetical protein
VALTALAGALAASVATARALELHDLGGGLDLLNLRTGGAHGLWALGFAAMAAAAGGLAPRRPVWSATLAGVAGVGGFLAVGGLWFLPGALLLGSAFWGFALVETPGSPATRSAADAAGGPAAREDAFHPRAGSWREPARAAGSGSRTGRSAADVDDRER